MAGKGRPFEKGKAPKSPGRPKGSMDGMTAKLRRAFDKVLTDDKAEEVIEKALSELMKSRPALFTAILSKCVKDAPREIERSGDIPVSFTIGFKT